MTMLSDFDAADAELLSSLLVRAGMNVSYAEDEDGEADDELEMRALEACIRHVASMEGKPRVIREIAKYALDQRGSWDKWSQGVFNIEPLCAKAVQVFSALASEDETREYRAVVVEVATAVAQAYGEFGEEEPESGFFGGMMKKVMGGFGGAKDAGHPMNISAAEDSAISRISQALKNA